MSAYFAWLGGAMGLVIALRRIDAFRRKQAIDQNFVHTRTELAVRKALTEPEALRIEILTDGFSVASVSNEYDSEVAAGIVKRTIPHFVANAHGTRPVSYNIRRTIRRGFPDFPIPESVRFYRMPLCYTAPNNDRDAAGFSAFLQRVRDLPRFVSLTDLSKNAEAAFLETRPAGFDFHAYYRNNR